MGMGLTNYQFEENQISERMEVTRLMQFQYIQIYNMLKIILRDNGVMRQLMKFEVITMWDNSPKFLVNFLCPSKYKIKRKLKNHRATRV